MKFTSIICDDTGAVSSVRVIMLFYFAVVTSVWAYTCVQAKALVEIPVGVISMGASLLALKGVQNVTENQASAQTLQIPVQLTPSQPSNQPPVQTF